MWAQGMILGQQYDLDAESNEYDDVQKIHELKTGKLIQVAISMPHLGNEKQDNLRMILHDIGKDLGLAFQIIDDVLEHPQIRLLWEKQSIGYIKSES